LALDVYALAKDVNLSLSLVLSLVLDVNMLIVYASEYIQMYEKCMCA